MAKVSRPFGASARAKAVVAANGEVRTTTRLIYNRSQIMCPVDTGRLRASGSMSFRGGGGGLIGSVVYDARYAEPVHDGHRAFVVRPRRAQVLRFQVGGRIVYAKFARIPASKGRPFLTDAAKQVARARGHDYQAI